MSEWEMSPTKSGLVSIGTHRLHVSVSGPVRRHSPLDGLHTNDPVVIVFPGSGESSSSWPRVQEVVSKFARIVLYDRSGLGQSDDAPHTAINQAATAAKELRTLLEVTQISGPYVLLAHSYGGVVCREFLHLKNEDVAGMVLADSATERQPEYFSMPNPDLLAVLGDLSYSQVTGLKAGAQLSREEWKARAIDISQRAKGYAAEVAAFYEVCETLGKKNQLNKKILGSRPLSVISCQSFKDYEKIYEAGVKAGNGTPEQQQKFRQWLDHWDDWTKELHRDLLQLSSLTRWVELDCGHNINLLQPDALALETRWVLQNIVTKPLL
ncbi:hypothetical protein PISL3812_03285 [Talaromyces islandicus]|uniref:AB hydrolase-1 domain-containing protein n=1 Tax=Talaromyces islandicus TaxID=28573 RepID=A0A0U1LUM3_TALIS|nr:hypothetical protein PISL3812_03285 [Talaromyces islandicus]